MKRSTGAIPALLALVFFVGCTDIKTIDRAHTAILFFDTEGKLQIDYEGSGYRQFSSTGSGEILFRAIHFDGQDGADIHD